MFLENLEGLTLLTKPERLGLDGFFWGELREKHGFNKCDL